MKARNTTGWLRAAALGLGMATVVGATGCQVDVGGQTLPSGYYLDDDVQYFPPGHRFKLQNEADAQAIYRANKQLEQGAAP